MKKDDPQVILLVMFRGTVSEQGYPQQVVRRQEGGV